jgi:hypothetical protein
MVMVTMTMTGFAWVPGMAAWQETAAFGMGGAVPGRLAPRDAARPAIPQVWETAETRAACPRRARPPYLDRRPPEGVGR